MSEGPTEKHRRLERAVGTWEGGERLASGPGGDVEALARSRTWMAAGGCARITEYRHTVDGEVGMQGHSVTIWHPVESCYVMYWFDSLGSPPALYRGDFEGDALVLTGPGPQGSRIRHVTDFPDPDTMRTVSHLSMDGERWQKVFHGVYHRVET